MSKLIGEDYVKVIDKSETEPFKEDVHGPFWRRYETFFPQEIGTLKFVCTHWFIPKLKLIPIYETYLIKKQKTETYLFWYIFFALIILIP